MTKSKDLPLIGVDPETRLHRIVSKESARFSNLQKPARILPTQDARQKNAAPCESRLPAARMRRHLAHHSLTCTTNPKMPRLQPPHIQWMRRLVAIPIIPPTTKSGRKRLNPNRQLSARPKPKRPMSKRHAQRGHLEAVRQMLPAPRGSARMSTSLLRSLKTRSQSKKSRRGCDSTCWTASPWKTDANFGELKSTSAHGCRASSKRESRPKVDFDTRELATGGGAVKDLAYQDIESDTSCRPGTKLHRDPRHRGTACLGP